MHKKGPDSEPSNYRPISIIPVVAKVFERALKNRIVSFLESEGLFCSAQYGFRKSLSTTSAIAKVMSIITEGFNKGEYVGALFCDLTKAFDCVNIGILLDKLALYGFGSKALSLMESYVHGRKQAVYHNGVKSELLDVKNGVPQGSVLGPILFLIYVNDLVNFSAGVESVLFADDTTLVARDFRLDSLSERLREVLRSASGWFAANYLTLNPSKTVQMCFTLRDVEDSEYKKQVAFLGVKLDSKLTWANHTEHLIRVVAPYIYALRNLVPLVSGKVARSVYFATVQSRLTYSILTWGHCSSVTRIFAMQRRAVRVIDHLGYREDCRGSFTRLGIMTIPSYYAFECLAYVREHVSDYVIHCQVNTHNTRNNGNIVLDFNRVNKARMGTNHYGPMLFNKLPVAIRSLPLATFRLKIKRFLIDRAFYTYDEVLANISDMA